jgi:tryptophan halogenase
MHLLSLFPEQRTEPILTREFNRRMDVEYARIRDFLILHYHLNTRDDAELWRYCRSMGVPESLSQSMAMFKHRGHIERHDEGLFTPPSWLSVFVGQGLLPERHHPAAGGLEIDRLAEELRLLTQEIEDRVLELPKHDAVVARYSSDLPTGLASFEMII